MHHERRHDSCSSADHPAFDNRHPLLQPISRGVKIPIATSGANISLKCIYIANRHALRIFYQTQPPVNLRELNIESLDYS